MPRVNVRTKNKRGEFTCGRCGVTIQVGDNYYWWKPRYGVKQIRCKDHRPRQSELTTSKMSTIYAEIEYVEDHLPDAQTIEAVTELVQNLATTVGEVAMEYRDAAENFGGVGDMADRADELETWENELANWEPNVQDEDDEKLADAVQQAEAMVGECPL